MTSHMVAAMRALVFAAGVLLLSLPALVNGVPFFFADSGAYVGGGQTVFREVSALLGGADGASGPAAPAAEDAPAFVPGPDAPGEPTIKGRSVYYAIFAYLGLLAGQLWPVVILQALALFWLVTLVCRRAFPAKWEGPALATAAGLALLSPAGLFAGMVMPDIWAGMMILAAALLATSWPELRRIERLLLLGIVLFAVLSHLSHLLLLVSLVVLLAALLPFRTRLGTSRLLFGAPLAWMGLCVGLGIAGDVAFSAAVERITGEPPISRPHLTAHLVDEGPGVAYAQAACPEAGFAVCDHADRLPIHWTRFLFGPTAEEGVFMPASPEAKRALAAEDKAFALAVLRFRPVETTGFLIADGLDQVGRFGVDRILTTPHGLPADIARTSEDSLSARQPWLLDALTTLSYMSALAGLVLVAAAWAVRSDAPSAQLSTLVAIALLGVIGNAAICGMLASPEGRFQARVVWLLPLVGPLLFFGFSRRLGAGPIPSEDSP